MVGQSSRKLQAFSEGRCQEDSAVQLLSGSSIRMSVYVVKRPYWRWTERLVCCALGHYTVEVWGFSWYNLPGGYHTPAGLLHERNRLSPAGGAEAGIVE
jgi:hypothetical protein